MSGPDVIKPEMMKSCVWLQTADGFIEQVEQDVALFCPFIRHKMHAGMGSLETSPISLPAPVNRIILSMILEYCRFHHLSGRSNLERKSFDEKFIRMDSNRLRELVSAADSLQMTPLVDLISGAFVKVIEGKTQEEIRQAFGLPDDATEEDKWEPIKIATEDPQVRLLNKLYARKRKEKEKLKSVEVEAPQADDRSIDELLSFINGENGGPKEAKPSRNKKNRKRKEKQQNAPSVTENHRSALEGELDDSDIGDGIDPVERAD